MPRRAFTDRPDDICDLCGKRAPLLFHQEGTGRMMCIECEKKDSGYSSRKVMR